MAAAFFTRATTRRIAGALAAGAVAGALNAAIDAAAGTLGLWRYPDVTTPAGTRIASRFHGERPMGDRTAAQRRSLSALVNEGDQVCAAVVPGAAPGCAVHVLFPELSA